MPADPIPAAGAPTPPTFVCGPTCGCGKSYPMVIATNVFPPCWTLPSNCPHCGKENVGNLYIADGRPPTAIRFAPVSHAGTTDERNALESLQCAIKRHDTLELPMSQCLADFCVSVEKLRLVAALAARSVPPSAGVDEDAARLDWWDANKLSGPSVGVGSDGLLGFHRGHITHAVWVVKGVQYLGIRDAIDAARALATRSTPQTGEP